MKLCWWFGMPEMPAQGKEYPELGYKQLRDRPRAHEGWSRATTRAPAPATVRAVKISRVPLSRARTAIAADPTADGGAPAWDTPAANVNLKAQLPEDEGRKPGAAESLVVGSPGTGEADPRSDAEHMMAPEAALEHDKEQAAPVPDGHGSTTEARDK
ncbi:hypothetical protein QJQ45_029000 [Haematococcus lacustris]|nr:hypothetical protein QJQ45_029000 [Haematococcus lacustris]